MISEGDNNNNVSQREGGNVDEIPILITAKYFLAKSFRKIQSTEKNRQNSCEATAEKQLRIQCIEGDRGQYRNIIIKERVFSKLTRKRERICKDY